MDRPDRGTQTLPLNERLALEGIGLRERAKMLPAGAERDNLKKARRFEVATQLDNWLSSPGLKSPR
jgi:hypothetical protein